MGSSINTVEFIIGNRKQGISIETVLFCQGTISVAPTTSEQVNKLAIIQLNANICPRAEREQKKIDSITYSLQNIPFARPAGWHCPSIGTASAV